MHMSASALITVLCALTVCEKTEVSTNLSLAISMGTFLYFI